jgi:transaldolase
MTRLLELFSTENQSPWLDNLRRSWIVTGELENWINNGVRGITSNPTIFQKAMTDTNDYDSQLTELIASGKSIEESYWELVVEDINGALDILRPLYDKSDGLDGFVSLEVDPSLADDTSETITAARHLHSLIDKPNLYVKIPATSAGIPAIQQLISDGKSINVTLIFSLDRYEEVIEAYLSGLESCKGDLSNISSVASFFISRTDTEVDKRLQTIGSDNALALQGKAAIAQGRAAYQIFKSSFSGPRWNSLQERGANPQRPLWASTSTKNPEFPDTLYVDELIGPETVNTIPDSTLKAFIDHGKVARTIDSDNHDSSLLEKIEKEGVNLHEVAQLLEEQGVASFTESFNDLLETLHQKVAQLKN